MKILELLDRPIAFQRSFVTLTGSVTAALMLSQAVYWTARATLEGGWFYKTQEEWELETGMTRYEQEGARKVLRAKGFMEEKKVGVPCRVHYRVSLETLQTSLGKTSKLDCGKPADWFGENQQTITETTAETTAERKAKTLVESADSTPPQTLFPEGEQTTPPTPSRGPADVIREHLFPYYLEAAGRDGYALTPLRLKKGVERLRECLKRTNDPGKAVELFEQAIDGLTADPWNCGGNPQKKKYLDWIDHLCKSAEMFDKRLDAGVAA